MNYQNLMTQKEAVEGGWQDTMKEGGRTLPMMLKQKALADTQATHMETAHGLKKMISVLIIAIVIAKTIDYASRNQWIYL